MRLLRAPLVAFALLALPLPARADGVSLEGGFCLLPRAESPWVETWAEIENSGAAEFRGVLEASLPGYTGTGPRASREVAVAPGTKKRFHLILSTGAGSRRDLVLRLTAERTGKEAGRRVVAGGWRGGSEKTMVIVAPPGAPTGLLAALDDRGIAGKFVRWPADEAHLPETLEGWSSAGLVVLEEANLDLWSAEQRTSLRDWVAMGGQVLLIPGSDPRWLSTAGVQKLAGFGKATEGDGPRKEKRGLMYPRPKLVWEFEDPGEPLLPNAPSLARTWSIGNGQVGAVTFDVGPMLVEDEKLSYAAGVFARDVLDGFFPPPASPWREYSQPQIYEWRPFVQALGHGLVRYPKTGWVLLVLFAYVALIGPLNFWVLRKKHAPAWTVVTVPAIGIAATAALLGAGWIARDSRVLVNRVTVLTEAESGWKLREHVVVVTGRRREALLSSPAGRLAAMTDGRREPDQDTAYAGADGASISRTFEPNQPAYFYTVGRQGFGTVLATLDSSRPANRSLHVENLTKLDITAAWYYESGQEPQELGEIRAGGAIDRSCPLITVMLRPYQLPEDTSPDAELLRSLAGQFYAPGASVLVAFVKTPFAPPVVDGEARVPERDVTVLVIPVSEISK